MSDSDADSKASRLEPEVRDMKLEPDTPAEDGDADVVKQSVEEDGKGRVAVTPNGHAASPGQAAASRTQTPIKSERSSGSPGQASEREEILGGDITVKMEPGKGPKLARSTSQKFVSRPPPLYLDHENKTEEAKETFDVIESCTYGNKSMGQTEHALECDCAEEWDAESRKNLACGEDSDCINRATKMECVGDCGCGPNCQNQRFLRKQYADVTVFKTEKKGYGLRANTDLKPNDFVYEYIGEVINERTFRNRMVQYDHEKIKHFYFMSLSKGEFVDATKKGNLGRFCNHSCNPNCFVDKWVVGDKLRMGIFAERHIKAGEELVFNYNVDRYGADPQPCYCGEANCTGFIGGKTQTDNATKLSHATIEALGIDDEDGWDTAVAKKPRKKKISEDDEEYVNNVQPKSLDEGGVTKVMATLMQCKEKWIAVKLLSRIQRSDDEKVMNRVIRMHGYQILKTTLNTFMDDQNVALQVLEILDKMPRLSRNKIQNSNIEETIEKLQSCEDERVSSKASRLLHEWSQLKMEYRIPRVKREQNGPSAYDSRWAERTERVSKERSASPDAPKGPSNRNPIPARPFPGGRGQFRRPPHFNPLPHGWFMTQDADKRTYYYSASGATSWQRPTTPAPQAPAPSKEKTHQQKLQEIIREITDGTPKTQSPGGRTPQPESAKKEKPPSEEKWRSYSEEKQKKIYENTIFPHVSYVLNKFSKKLPKEDLKRLGKEISKKIVASDYKRGRVEDPTKLSEKHVKDIKKHVHETLEKACEKKKKLDKQKVDGSGSTTPPGDPGVAGSQDNDMPDASAGARAKGETSEDSPGNSSKRKRHDETSVSTPMDGEDESPFKRLKSTDVDTPPPPPPPPPPADSTTFDEQGDAIDDADTPDAFQQAALDSFENESFEPPIRYATVRGAQAKNEIGVQVNRAVKAELGDVSGANGHPSPMQLATPSTNDSYDNFDGMHSDRLRHLGVANGR
ncbi:WW/Rsp5/WWP [Lasiodiplodia theobromae]|uniref:Histone-lysine N-methyltransferase, H3 lysine-36 specific n=1 Tax=Lasiodiplodia theobromae TaxID=45133 RepID=A0A5N5D5E3_9PEZI|nr:Histone-lysine N-methyltransferase, H3 lysine-36 specific [Lasiodiplodia theobromae]KAF9634151.1 WW/Rsp5/WWP [Lasiodiplodia theobromae]